MIAAIFRLFALRPLFTIAILGVPIIVLIAIGLFTIIALKLFIFVVMPIILIAWVVRRVFGSGKTSEA